MEYMLDLKDMLCAELEDVAEQGRKKGKISSNELETLHRLTDTVKNILKINALEDNTYDGYSSDSDWMGEGRIYGTSRDHDGQSYARGRKYAKRDSMGRYSSHNIPHDDSARGMHRDVMYSRDTAKHDMITRLRDMRHTAQTAVERDAIDRCIDTLERI